MPWLDHGIHSGARELALAVTEWIAGIKSGNDGIGGRRMTRFEMGTAPSTLAGRCNCGAVTFTASGPFRPAKACHCKTCRRQSGHFVAATETNWKSVAVMDSGSLAWFAATGEAARGFCRDCGAHLFWRRTGSERVSIWMGCLDEPTGIRLADHIFVAEKGDYYEIADGLPQRPLGSGTPAR
jgi:hypothetical protein